MEIYKGEDFYLQGYSWTLKPNFTTSTNLTSSKYATIVLEPQMLNNLEILGDAYPSLPESYIVKDGLSTLRGFIPTIPYLANGDIFQLNERLAVYEFPTVTVSSTVNYHNLAVPFQNLYKENVYMPPQAHALVVKGLGGFVVEVASDWLSITKEGQDYIIKGFLNNSNTSAHAINVVSPGNGQAWTVPPYSLEIWNQSGDGELPPTSLIVLQGSSMSYTLSVEAVYLVSYRVKKDFLNNEMVRPLYESYNKRFDLLQTLYQIGYPFIFEEQSQIYQNYTQLLNRVTLKELQIIQNQDVYNAGLLSDMGKWLWDRRTSLIHVIQGLVTRNPLELGQAIAQLMNHSRQDGDSDVFSAQLINDSKSVYDQNEHIKKLEVFDYEFHDDSKLDPQIEERQTPEIFLNSMQCRNYDILRKKQIDDDTNPRIITARVRSADKQYIHSSKKNVQIKSSLYDLDKLNTDFPKEVLPRATQPWKTMELYADSDATLEDSDIDTYERNARYIKEDVEPDIMGENGQYFFIKQVVVKEDPDNTTMFIPEYRSLVVSKQLLCAKPLIYRTYDTNQQIIIVNRQFIPHKDIERFMFDYKYYVVSLKDQSYMELSEFMQFAPIPMTKFINVKKLQPADVPQFWKLDPDVYYIGELDWEPNENYYFGMLKNQQVFYKPESTECGILFKPKSNIFLPQDKLPISWSLAPFDTLLGGSLEERTLMKNTTGFLFADQKRQEITGQGKYSDEQYEIDPLFKVQSVGSNQLRFNSQLINKKSVIAHRSRTYHVPIVSVTNQRLHVVDINIEALDKLPSLNVQGYIQYTIMGKSVWIDKRINQDQDDEPDEDDLQTLIEELFAQTLGKPSNHPFNNLVIKLQTEQQIKIKERSWMASLVAWCLNMPDGTFTTGGITTGYIQVGKNQSPFLAAAYMDQATTTAKMEVYMTGVREYSNYSALFLNSDQSIIAHALKEAQVSQKVEKFIHVNYYGYSVYASPFQLIMCSNISSLNQQISNLMVNNNANASQVVTAFKTKKWNNLSLIDNFKTENKMDSLQTSEVIDSLFDNIKLPLGTYSAIAIVNKFFKDVFNNYVAHANLQEPNLKAVISEEIQGIPSNVKDLVIISAGLGKIPLMKLRKVDVTNLDLKQRIDQFLKRRLQDHPLKTRIEQFQLYVSRYKIDTEAYDKILKRMTSWDPVGTDLGGVQPQVQNVSSFVDQSPSKPLAQPIPQNPQYLMDQLEQDQNDVQTNTGEVLVRFEHDVDI